MRDINGLRCLWWPSMRACVPSITARRVICFQLHWIAGDRVGRGEKKRFEENAEIIESVTNSITQLVAKEQS